MGDSQRAKDHYRWADRYMRYGDTEKAAAHMKRALHYSEKPKSKFGTGSTAGAGTGPGPAPTSPGPAPTSHGLRVDTDTDLIFVLAPLNLEAAGRIRSSIRQSTRDGKKVEVYMQAFTENEPGSPITAPNLLPMNFNQYSSDHPGVLVDIISEFREHTGVRFYIFPTQTTKNSYFWSNEAKQKMVDMLKHKKDKVDPWILMAIVTWLLKDGDIKNVNGKDGNTPGSLRERFDNVHDDDAAGTKGDFTKMDDQLQAGKVPILPIFDPFCVHCAAYKTSDSVPFKLVPGSGKLSAAPVSVYMNDDFTNHEIVEYLKAKKIKQGELTKEDENQFVKHQLSILESTMAADEKNKIMTDSDHVGMHRPRFEKATGKNDSCYNCYRVGWDSDKATEHAKNDGIKYMECLLASVCGEPCELKRIVNRVLFVQDFYDYDNKFGVWYALVTIGAAIFELYSVSRPVADKELMKNLRSKFNPFDLDGGFINLQSALGKAAMDEWQTPYPPASPVYTKKKFNDIITASKPAAAVTDERESKVRRVEDHFQAYKNAILADHTRESLDDSKKIALTWYVFLCYMVRNKKVGYIGEKMMVTNGGYTRDHRFNPAMHTIQEDWITDVSAPQIGTLYNQFEVGNNVTVPSDTKEIDKILENLEIKDLKRLSPAAAATAFGARQRLTLS